MFDGLVQSMRKEEPLPMKVVGRNTIARVDVVAIDGMQRMANVLRASRPFVPRGVWRFKTFEEADSWTLRMLTRRPKQGSQP